MWKMGRVKIRKFEEISKNKTTKIIQRIGFLKPSIRILLRVKRRIDLNSIIIRNRIRYLRQRETLQGG